MHGKHSTPGKNWEVCPSTLSRGRNGTSGCAVRGASGRATWRVEAGSAGSSPVARTGTNNSRSQARGLAVLQPYIITGPERSRRAGGWVGSPPACLKWERQKRAGISPCPSARFKRASAPQRNTLCSTQFRYSADRESWRPATCCRSRKTGQARGRRVA